MPTTARDIVNRSLMLIGVLPSEESASASELSDGLDSLNDLLESWSNDGFMIFSETREEFSLSLGQSLYTIGTGGDFDTQVPHIIEAATVKESPGDTEIPIKVYSQKEWARVSLKNTESTLPQVIYFNDTYPLGEIHVWPVPSGASTLVLYSLKPLAKYGDANDELNLPNGYARALRYNLAMELAPEYGRVPNELVAFNAAESKAEIKRKNTRPVLMKSDAQDLVDRKTFNWLTGE